MNFWRCWAQVGLLTMDPAYMRATPPMVDSLLEPDKMLGWWRTMAFESLYGAWPVE